MTDSERKTLFDAARVALTVALPSKHYILILPEIEPDGLIRVYLTTTLDESLCADAVRITNEAIHNNPMAPASSTRMLPMRQLDPRILH